jgi:hypothetical protein
MYKKVITETGSVYEFDMSNLMVRRLEHTKKSQDLRQDGEWLQMLIEPGIEVGQSIVIALAPLGDPENTECTMRYTTPVLKVEEVDG